jgi:hypothetical protein
VLRISAALLGDPIEVSSRSIETSCYISHWETRGFATGMQTMPSRAKNELHWVANVHDEFAVGREQQDCAQTVDNQRFECS